MSHAHAFAPRLSVMHRNPSNNNHSANAMQHPSPSGFNIPLSPMPNDGHYDAAIHGNEMSESSWMTEDRARTLSSDSAAFDPFYAPMRGQSLDLQFANNHNANSAAMVNAMHHAQHTSAAGDAGHVDASWTPSMLPPVPTPSISASSFGSFLAQPFYATPVAAQRAVYASGPPSAAPQPANAYSHMNGQYAHPPRMGAHSSPPPQHPHPRYQQSMPVPSYAAAPVAAMAAAGLSHVQTVKQPPTTVSRIPLTIQLRSGTGKKKVWPNRTVVSDPMWSFSQLLFHAANLSTFIAVSVESESMQNEARLKDSRVVHDWLNANAEAPPSQLASAQKIEVVFDLPANVKSCTRLGCPNLLVNKANRRACSVCQSQGAELFPAQIRVVHLPVGNPAVPASASNPSMASASAYLDLYLDQFEHWKFDGSEDGLHFIVFTDELTAQRVSTEMRQNLGASFNDSSALLQPVDPSQSYLIRMKSHFWMLQIKPLDPELAAQAKIKLYKKVGKPNQSRSNKDKDKEEKEENEAQRNNSNSKLNDDRPVIVASSATPSPMIGHALQASALSRPTSYDLHGSRSPASDMESDSSVHSYPSLPALGQGTPSSPDSYHSGSSGSVASHHRSSHPHHGHHHHLKRHIEEELVDSEAARRGSFSTDSNASSTPPSVTGDFLTQLDDTNLLSVTDAAFFSMKQSKPVNAMMQIHSQQPLMVASMIGASPSIPSTVPSVSGNSNGSVHSVQSPPSVAPLTTPVVLVYRDIASYESDRRRLRKSGNGSGGNDGSRRGGERNERKDKDSDSKEDDNDSGNDRHSGKRRRFDNADSGDSRHTRQQLAAAMPSMPSNSHHLVFGGDVEMSHHSHPSSSFLDGADEKDGFPHYSDWDIDVIKPAGSKLDSLDVLRMSGSNAGPERLVVMPADFANMLMDPNKMQSLYSSLKQIEPTDKGQLTFWESASESLLDNEEPQVVGVDLTKNPSQSQQLNTMLHSDDHNNNHRSKKHFVTLQKLRRLRSHSACELISVVFGMVALILLATLIAVPDAKYLTHDAPRDREEIKPSQTVNILSKSVIASMVAISPVFAAWANSSAGISAVQGNDADTVVRACIDATTVSKTLGDHLLRSEGALEIYRSIGITQPSGAAADDDTACARLAYVEQSSVAPAYLKALLCSVLSLRTYGGQIQTFCQQQSPRQFEQTACKNLLQDIRDNNATATVFVGIKDYDKPPQYTVEASSPGGGQFMISEYISLNQPSVRAVEMSALAYHFQSLSLASTCATFTVVNSMQMNSFEPGQNPMRPNNPQDADSTGAKVLHPAFLALIVIGAPGLFALLQMLGAMVATGAVAAVNKAKKL